MEQYTRPNPSVLKEKLIQFKLIKEELPQNKEQEPLPQVVSETHKDCIITDKQKPNLKRKRPPTPKKSSKQA